MAIRLEERCERQAIEEGFMEDHVLSEVDSHNAPLLDVFRLKVPGGWIYRTKDWGDSDSPCLMTSVFVPEEK